MRRFTRIGSVVVLVAAILVAPGLLAAQGCIDFSDKLHQLGASTTFTKVRGVALDGDLAYVTNWQHSSTNSDVMIYDISTPNGPQQIFDESLHGWARGIVLVHDHAVVGNGQEGLEIYDISSLGAMFSVDTVDTPGTACWPTLYDGDQLALADYDGLRLYDFGDPVNSTLLGTYTPAGAVYHVTVVDTLAYMAVEAAGLEIVSINDPAAIYRVGLIDIPGNAAQDVCVVDDLAFVVDLYGSLQVVDIADPTAPELRGNIPIQTYCYSIEAAGDHVLIGSAGLTSVDYSDPDAPEVVGFFPLSTVYDIAMTDGGEVGYLGSYSDGFVSISLGDGTTPSTYATVDLDTNPWEIDVEQDLAALGGNSPNTLVLMDIGDPLAPTVAGELALPDWPEDVEIHGDYAYIPASDGGLLVVDIVPPDAPSLEATVPTPYYARSSVVSGNHLYVGCDGNLRAYSLANPALPVDTGNAAAPSYIYGLGADGDMLAAACGNDGMRIYDISNPDQPVQQGGYDDLNSWQEAAVVGDLAFFTVGDSYDDCALMIFNISNPLSPNLLSTTPFSSQYGAYSVKVRDGQAYVAAQGVGYWAFDVSDPAAPAFFGGVEADWCMALDLTIDHVVMAASIEGIKVGPVQCGPVPVFLASFTATPLPGGVNLRWETSSSGAVEFRLEAAQDGRLRELPWTEQLPGLYAATDRDPGLAAGGRVEYRLWGRETGEDWQFLRSEQVELAPVQATSRIESAWPNPFNPHCTLRFSLAAAGQARVELIDLAGRHVRTLMDGAMAAGPHELIWNGRDDDGREVASGIYFARLLSAGGVDTHKLVLLR